MSMKFIRLFENGEPVLEYRSRSIPARGDLVFSIDEDTPTFRVLEREFVVEGGYEQNETNDDGEPPAFDLNVERVTCPECLCGERHGR